MTYKHTSCQSCGDSLISPLFCFSCNSLQNISDDMNHFEVMGLPQCFEIDSGELDSLYPVSYTHLRAHETREDRGLGVVG